MDRRYYRAGEFARRAAVSIRTLHHYDREGLLRPSGHTEAGYRLYTDADLVRLQQILALKFLGFPLDRIKALVRDGPESLADVLAQQKAMMREKRAQLDSIIRAIEKTENLVRTGQPGWDDLVDLIREIQMDQNKDWVNKHLTPDQQERMAALTATSYSESAAPSSAERGPWTEADQQRVSEQWTAVYAEVRRLSAAGADPAGAEALALARQHADLVGAFTGGDPEIAAGLKQWWQSHNALPRPQQPLPSPLAPAEQAFLDQALVIRGQRQ